MSALIIVQSMILLALGALHLYWSIGGTWGFDNSLPTNEDGKRMLNPKKVASAIVGIGLCLFSIFYLTKMDVIPVMLPLWASKFSGWFISIIFSLRALGDFKYVGFFKKIKNTPFGKLDTRFFSPLCLVLGIFGILIELIK